MFLPRLRVALAVSALAAGGALAVALGSEAWGGLIPCALCLVERWPYRAAVLLALLGLVLPRQLARLLLWLVLLCGLLAIVAAGVHVGVEQGLWPSPLPQCQAPDVVGMSIAERLAHMPDKPSVACEDPTRLIRWIPVSMAQMNLVYALALSGGIASFLWRTRRSAP
jgi:disulfide bond formation protein DsbB